MARIAGVDLPKNERVEIGLTRIFGIGRPSALRIVAEIGVDPKARIKDLKDDDIVKIRTVIDREFKVEGDKRREITAHIKRLTDIGCYRGLRHRFKLPVRGQRTRTNARTRKGPRKAVMGKRKAL